MKSVTLLFYYILTPFYLCYTITKRSLRHKNQQKASQIKHFHLKKISTQTTS